MDPISGQSRHSERRLRCDQWPNLPTVAQMLVTDTDTRTPEPGSERKKPHRSLQVIAQQILESSLDAFTATHLTMSGTICQRSEFRTTNGICPWCLEVPGEAPRLLPS